VKTIRLIPAVALLAALAGCGQKGPLYLPEQPKEIVTRPTQTPAGPQAPQPAPEAPPLPQAPSSPQTADSPEGQASPAPEVVLPTPAESEEKKKQEAARPR
jgi:predicted small lipoprotein YifL